MSSQASEKWPCDCQLSVSWEDILDLPSNTVSVENESISIAKYFALGLVRAPDGSYEATLLSATADDDLCIAQ